MKLALRARKTYTKVTLMATAFILAVSSLTASVPFILSQRVAAATYSVVSGSSIQAAINGASDGDVINVAAGTYQEDITVNKDVTIQGAGAGTTKIVATTGNTTPVTFSTNNATVSGFTITHEYTPAELSAWNFNNNGVAFNQNTTGNLLSNSVVSLNRNGVYLNNAPGNSLINNTITNNRTGVNLTNNVSNTTMTGNTISNNWTIGVVYYSQGGTTNFATVAINGNTFDQNWYTELLVKDAGSTYGVLNVVNNIFTDSPVTYSESSDVSLNEPGFAAQKPVSLGGSATKPAAELPTIRIYNSPLVTIDYLPDPTDVYVDDDYTSASAGGHTWNYDAFNTLDQGLNAVAVGGTVHLMNGTYTEKVTFPHDGITLVGQSRANTIIKPLSNIEGMGVYGAGVGDISIQRLTISTDSASGGSAIKFYNSHDIDLRNLLVKGNSTYMRGIDMNAVDGVTIVNTDVSHFGKNGIAITAKYATSDVYTTRNVRFNNVTSSNNGWNGLAFYTMNGPETIGNDIRNVRFLGANEFSNNGQSGISFIGDTDNAAIIALGALVPRWSVTGPSGATLSLGTTVLSGNGAFDVLNYQAKDVYADGVTINGKVGSAMNSAELTAAEARVFDKNDVANYGDVILDNTAPGAPTLVTPDWYIANGSTKTLQWNAPADLDINHYEYAEYFTAPTSDTTPWAWKKDITAPATQTTDTAWSTDIKIFWRVRAIDNAGNAGPWSETRTIITDKTKPVAVINSVTLGMDKKLNVSVTGTDNLSGVGRIGFNLYNNANTVKIADLQTLDYTAHNLSETSVLVGFDTSSLPDGTYKIRAAVRDVAGNLSSYTLSTITVDNTRPGANFNFPSVGLGATSFEVQYTEAVNPIEAGDPANYFLNNWPGAGGSGDLAANATVTYNPVTFKATVNFTAAGWYVSPEQQWGVQNVHDLAGNLLNPNPTTAYSTPMLAPSVPGAPNTTSPSNNRTNTWTWGVSSDQGTYTSGLAGYEYALVPNGDTPTSWSFTTDTAAIVTAPTDGNYRLFVRALDNAGNRSGASSGLVQIDSTAPVPQFDPLSVDATGTPTITGTVDDGGSSLALSVDGGAPISISNFGGSWSYTFTTPLSEGTHTLDLVAADSFGNVGNASAILTVALPVDEEEEEETETETPPAPQTTVTPLVTPAIINPAAIAQVLGDATTNQQATEDDGEVEGAATQNTFAAAVDTDSTDGTVFGLAWYWWLLILAALAGIVWWIVAAARRRNAEN